MKLGILFLFQYIFLTSLAAKNAAMPQNPKVQPIKNNSPDSLSAKLKLELTLLDLPFQTDAALTINHGIPALGAYFRGYANPSMALSLDLSSNIYSAAHFGLDRLFKTGQRPRRVPNRLLHIASLGVTDYILAFVPAGDGWLHEEYHRAMLTRHQVNSFNNINRFPIGQDLVTVDHVLDADLSRFKKEAPQDFARLHVAGIEGGYQLINRLQKNNFFYQQETSHEVLYWWITYNSIDYVTASSQSDVVDPGTDESNLEETLVSERDFTGFDFTAWAYDLFEPDEPYENRELHPSGNGIDRYIKTTDLSLVALDYLNRQGKLQFLNLLSPMLFFQKSIPWKNSFRFNFAIRHYLNSFGNDIALKFFFQKEDKKFILTYHHANNFERAFPALEAELFEHPFKIKNQPFLISPWLITGFQPERQSFFAPKAAFLGQAGLRLKWVSKSGIDPWVRFSAKTKGWIAGNEFLDSNLKLQFGLSKHFN